MAVRDVLEEDECYLWAILSDASGLDLAEFTWVDQEEDDGCFRCWPFQWKWFRDNAAHQIDQCARAVGKSLSIKMRAFIFPFVHPGKEMLITGPEGIHVDAITDLIETQFYTTRLGRETLVGGRFGVKHKPFHMNFSNGARIMGRIPQHSGVGVKGCHPIWLELDEAQDYPPAGWTELIETLKRGSQGAVWRAHGVTRGIRDKFYEYTDSTNPENRWKVHRMTAMHRPNWNDEERQEKIQMYNDSKDDPDYRRNVLGLHGDATNPIFVLTRLMRCVDDDAMSEYNSDEYYHIRLSDRQIADEDIANFLNLPTRHITDYKQGRKWPRFWCGMDIGFTRDPSEILVFVEWVPEQRWDREKQDWVNIPKSQRKSQLKLLTRISLVRIKVHDQAAVIQGVIDFYKPQAFSMDKAGNGIGLFQMVQEANLNSATSINGYNHVEKVVVDVDETVENDPYTGEIVNDAYMKRSMLEYCVDDETEVLTRRGWKSRTELQPDEFIYTLNPVSDVGEWQPLVAVHEFDGTRDMVSLESRSFSSLSTLDHAWLVDRYCPYAKKTKREWRTTDALVSACRIPRTRPQAFWPESKYDDDLVELVAWAWCEGAVQQGRLTIGQSLNRNPQHVARIQAALSRLFGPPEAQRYVRGGWRFTDRLSGQYASLMREFQISRQLSDVVLEHLGAHKAVKPEFLVALTRAQLELFVNVSILADGSVHAGRTQLAQMNEARIRSFEMACALLGWPTSTTTDSAGRFVCSVLKRQSTSPIQGKGLGTWRRDVVRHEGVVWCPEVTNHTWLARRHGSVYFTGNSTDKLRELVDAWRIYFPWDKNLIAQFQGASEVARQRGQDPYGRPRTFSAGEDHALDASRQAVMGYVQETIETLLAQEKFEPVADVFLEAW